MANWSLGEPGLLVDGNGPADGGTDLDSWALLHTDPVPRSEVGCPLSGGCLGCPRSEGAAEQREPVHRPQAARDNERELEVGAGAMVTWAYGSLNVEGHTLVVRQKRW